MEVVLYNVFQLEREEGRDNFEIAIQII